MYYFFFASSLEKVFLDEKPREMKETVLYTWPGEYAAVQMVYTGSEIHLYQKFDVEILDAPVDTELYHVRSIPSLLPAYEHVDDDYLRKTPGLYPDALIPADKAEIRPMPKQYRSMWIAFELPRDTKPGAYDIRIRIKAQHPKIHLNGYPVKYEDIPDTTLRLTLHVGAKHIQPQTLIHTEWFHTDSLCHYYGLSPFSEKYWHTVTNFIKGAVRCGINMILTPVFTPPLDTAVGTERLTVQLMDVSVEQGEYEINYDRLVRWLGICRQAGVRYIEMPHLFTQWGAKATPKIVAMVDGHPQSIFGWDVPADSPEYRKFLTIYLPSVRNVLNENGYDDRHVFYHISDEPGEDNLSDYLAAKAQTGDHLNACQVLDALSSFTFYQKGLVPLPICAIDHIKPFLDEIVDRLWAYYCCGQCRRVANRFFSMPSYRNRVIGALLYFYRIEGFLQWGYNFYESQYSLFSIDPYQCSDADGAFPSGDAYLVYPGKNGQPIFSIRSEVQREAFLDHRALKTLEEIIGREQVESILTDKWSQPMNFDDYPRNADFYLDLRKRIFEALER